MYCCLGRTATPLASAYGPSGLPVPGRGGFPLVADTQARDSGICQYPMLSTTRSFTAWTVFLINLCPRSCATQPFPFIHLCVWARSCPAHKMTSLLSNSNRLRSLGALVDPQYVVHTRPPYPRSLAASVSAVPAMPSAFSP